MTAPAYSSLWIIDDDLMSREVLTVLAAQVHSNVQAFHSGESALECLSTLSRTQPHAIPSAILADMQMPGVSGDSLARLLRAGCGTATTLVAMSGTRVPESLLSAFDAFLLKPFTMPELAATLEGHARSSAAHSVDPEALNPAIYASLAASLKPEQLRQLYAMSLDDADRRIGLMQQALADQDADAYRRAAHSIKGGCGMVGATELAALASVMEERGPEAIDNIGPLTEFLHASARLRRILDAL